MSSLVPPPDGNLDQLMQNEQVESYSDSDDETLNQIKTERDDMINPFWIEDRDLKTGQRDFLNGHETQFWKGLIEKYLAPLEKNPEKEKKNANDLITLRNQMVFSFFMINSLFVLIVFMLQQEKDTIFMRWPIGYKTIISYSNDEQVKFKVIV